MANPMLSRPQRDVAIVRKFGPRYKLVVVKYWYRPPGLELPAPRSFDPLAEQGFREVRMTAPLLRRLIEQGLLTEDDALQMGHSAQSVSRARSAVYELSLCNSWDYFLTLTLDPAKFDRFSLPSWRKALSQFLRDQRKKWGGDVRYLLIPEQHRDGAWHMHGLLSGLPREALSVNEHGYLDWPDYRRRFGFFSASPVRDPVRCAAYVTKYVSKDLAARSRLAGAHLYYASQGLERAEFIARGTLHPPPGWVPDYEGDYVCVDWADRNVWDIDVW